MVTEDYVSFETAKLLKGKDFDAKCSFVWAEQGNQEPIRMAMPVFVEGEEWADRKTVDIAAKDYINPYNAENNSVTGYLCPTLQMAMKWLREEKGIAVIPVLSSVLDSEKFLWDIKIVVAKTYDTYSQGWVYEKQEAACDTAIKYCLENLI